MSDDDTRRQAILCYLRAGEILALLPRMSDAEKEGMEAAVRSYAAVAQMYEADLSERAGHGLFD